MALILHILRQRNRVDNISRRLFRDRNNPLDYLTDEYIVKNYRLDRESIYRYSICQDLEQDLLRFTNRSHSIPVSLQVMIALRYYASGSYMSVIGDSHGVSKMTFSRCVNQVSRCTSHNLSNYVQFPMSAEVQQRVKYDFYDIKEFPLVLGAVDGTLIPIKTPSVEEHLYVSRKGYHAINIQCVCDANYMIRDIVAKWSGATHDAHNCKLAKAFEDGTIKGAWLLGGSGYALKPWLLTPILSSTTRAERKYNKAHKSTRCIIERTYRIWKMRVRCLHRGLTLTPKRSLDVAVATAGLHNVCMKKRIPFEYDETEEDEEDLKLPEGQIDSDEGRRLRDQLVQNVFAFQ